MDELILIPQLVSQEEFAKFYHLNFISLENWKHLVLSTCSALYYEFHFGKEIILKYSNNPFGFKVDVFDASGREVDELFIQDESGNIIWGEGFSPGVYFIRPDVGKTSAQKVILTY